MWKSLSCYFSGRHNYGIYAERGGDLHSYETRRFLALHRLAKAGMMVATLRGATGGIFHV